MNFYRLNLAQEKKKRLGRRKGKLERGRIREGDRRGRKMREEMGELGWREKINKGTNKIKLAKA